LALKSYDHFLSPPESVNFTLLWTAQGTEVNSSSKPIFYTLAVCMVVFAILFAMQDHVLAANSGRQVFNIVDYGAKNDGSVPATQAFEKAIKAAKAAGGGTIYVPAGKYTSGPIELFSNMTLDVDAGATIVFPVAPLAFTKGRYLGVEALVPMPLIGAHDVENVTITGRGVITTGDFKQWGKAYSPAPIIADHSENANGPNWDRLLKALEAKQTVTEAEYRAAAPELRPSVVSFTNARNVLVENVRIIGGPAFVVQLLYSENATVRNMMIEAYPGPHANGIVVDSSRFVRISDSYIDTGDDGIVIKSGKDADGLRVNRPAEHITVTNCTVHHAHGAVVIGSETSGGVRNVVASNITAVDTENGIRIKSRRGRGGIVEDVRFDNWTMENVGTGIVVTSYYIMGGERSTQQEPVSERTPTFRNIGISNVTISGAKKVADIDGLPEMPITGLRLFDVLGSGKVGLTARYTDGLQLHHIQINPDRGPAFTIGEASNAELDDLGTEKPLTDSPVLRLTNSPGAVVRASRAFPGTQTFLSTGPGELKSIHLVNNVLDSAKVPTTEN
jgi:polygalacturonase